MSIQYYLLSKIGADTAENGQTVAKKHLATFVNFGNIENEQTTSRGSRKKCSVKYAYIHSHAAFWSARNPDAYDQ